MKSIIIIHLCVLLLTIASNGVEGESLENILITLNKMAEDNGTIDGIFRPLENGFISGTLFTVSYKGFLIPEQIEVTMKFMLEKSHCDNEYWMYGYLGALTNPNVEKFGIPFIHFYHTWNGCGMIAMTLFDCEFHECLDAYRLTETDLLILFHEFVRITKYVHSRTVFLNHFRLRHMMFRDHQGFIQDFAGATIHPDGKCPDVGLYAAREDWQKMLRAIFSYIQESSNWNWIGYSGPIHLDFFFSKLKNDSRSNEQHGSTGLRRVLIEYAKSALSDDSLPINESFYDQPLQVIIEEIGRCAQQQRKPVTVSWLAEDQENVEPSSSSIGGSEKRHREESSTGPSKRFKE